MPARRDLFHLRIAAQRDGGRGRPVRQERQRRHPARRPRGDAFQRRPASRPGRLPGRSRPAGRRRATGDDDGSGGRRPLPADERMHRPGHPARRRGADSPRGRGGADAGPQALQGQLSRLRREERRPGHGRAHRGQRQVSAARRLQRGRRVCWSMRPRPPTFLPRGRPPCGDAASSCAAVPSRAASSPTPRPPRRRITRPNFSI